MPNFHAQFQPTSGLTDYDAFKAVDRRQVSLFLRPARNAYHWVKYATLLRIESSVPAGTSLLLLFTSLAVSIEGRNLNDVAAAIAKERCIFIEQFDPAQHIKPDDPLAPLIEHITVYAPDHPVHLKPASERA